MQEMNEKKNRALYWGWGTALTAMLALGLVLFFFSPTAYPFYPRCLFHALTGLQCPGCGGLRAVHYLLHGQLATAFHYHQLFILSLPVAAGYAVYHCVRRASGQPVFNPLEHPVCVWVLLGVILVFSVARNIPGSGLAFMGAS